MLREDGFFFPGNGNMYEREERIRTHVVFPAQVQDFLSKTGQAAGVLFLMILPVLYGFPIRSQFLPGLCPDGLPSY